MKNDERPGPRRRWGQRRGLFYFSVRASLHMQHTAAQNLSSPLSSTMYVYIYVIQERRLAHGESIPGYNEKGESMIEGAVGSTNQTPLRIYRPPVATSRQQQGDEEVSRSRGSVVTTRTTTATPSASSRTTEQTGTSSLQNAMDTLNLSDPPPTTTTTTTTDGNSNDTEPKTADQVVYIPKSTAWADDDEFQVHDHITTTTASAVNDDDVPVKSTKPRGRGSTRFHKAIENS